MPWFNVNLQQQQHRNLLAGGNTWRNLSCPRTCEIVTVPVELEDLAPSTVAAEPFISGKLS